jgi:uncharacterized protein
LGVFIRAEWRHLLMLNYAVGPELLGPYIPAGTELDAYRGVIYVSVVGFRFLRTRVLGVPVPYHLNFPEVNLRFYVRRRGPDGWRRGVVFIREVVPRRAIAAVARWRYGEAYQAMPMRDRVHVDARQGRTTLEYAWRPDHQWCAIGGHVDGEPQLARPGSEQEFIAEHYWGYTHRDDATREYRVEHPAWRLWHAWDPYLDCDIGAMWGRAFVAPLSARPRSAFVAEGSRVAVFGGRKIG